MYSGDRDTVDFLYFQTFTRRGIRDRGTALLAAWPPLSCAGVSVYLYQSCSVYFVSPLCISTPGGPDGLSLPGGPDGLPLPGGPDGLSLPGGPDGLSLPGGPDGLPLPAGP